MTKQITKASALECLGYVEELNEIEDVFDPNITNIIKQFIYQQDEVEAKRLEEIEEGYINIFGKNHNIICEGLNCECHKKVKSFIKQACKQYSAPKEKETLELRQTVSDLSQKLEMINN